MTSQRPLSANDDDDDDNDDNNNNNNNSVVFSVKRNQKLRKIHIFWDMMYNLIVRY